MNKLLLILSLLFFSTQISAQNLAELEGVWVPDVVGSIALMQVNMSEVDVEYMTKRYLPNLKRVIENGKFTTTSGRNEYQAEMIFKENNGDNIIVVISAESATNRPDVEVTFIAKKEGMFIMQSSNEDDGSGNILWKKQ